VRTHVALLRGINVGGRNKIAMADLRELVSSLGHTEVATYIQSGNVLFASPQADAARLAADMEAAIAERLGLSCSVVIVSREQLAQVIADNPYPQAISPKHLHAVFRNEDLTAEGIKSVAEAQQRAADKGSPDQVTVVGRTLFLHTPDGLGRSELAAQLARPAVARQAAGTARNWATVAKLQSLLDE
jgi:uncharacterized protein (DUF1697 family)